MRDLALVKPCVTASGTVTEKGYVRISVDGKWGARAHRVAWIKAHGDPGPGVDIHHRCGNRACVELTHLEALPHVDHARFHRVGELPRELGNECFRGHEFTEGNTYRRPGGRRECRTCRRAARGRSAA